MSEEGGDAIRDDQNNNDNDNNNGDNNNIACVPIVSALLTFTVAIYRNGSHDRVIQLLMSEFNINEIKEAKNILCDVAKQPFHKRRTTDTRSEKTAHLVDICEIITKLDDNNMPLFVMDSVSFARLPRVNAEDVSYIAIASRLAETNAKLDMMNTLISENAARSLQNEERVQYLARNNANPPQQPKYSSVASGNASRHHQATYGVTHKPGQSASSCKIGGITDSRNDQFRMPPPISNVTHLSMSTIPSGTERQQGVTVPAKPADVTVSGSQTTVSASASQSTAAASGNQCSVSAVGSQSTVPVSDSLSNVVPTNGGGQSSSESAISPSGAQNNHEETAHGEGEGASGDSQQQQQRMHNGGALPIQFINGPSDSLRRTSSQQSLESTGNINNSDTWQNVDRNRRRNVDNPRLTRSRRVHGTANSSKVTGTSDPHGYLWISRVHKDTEDDDMHEWVANMKVNIIEFVRTSHDEAKSKSFKLTVPFGQFHRLLNPEIWPTNVEVSRFRFPRDRDNIDRPRS